MNNIPAKIYLQIGEDTSTKEDIDFEELCGVTWCSERINKSDIVYYRKTKKK